MQYVAKFIELARFADNFVATVMAIVWRFEDGLKWAIQGKVIGHHLQDFDVLVEMAMAIERVIDNVRNIWETRENEKKKEGQSSSSSSGKQQKTFAPQWSQIQG